MTSALRPRRLRPLSAFTDFEIILFWYLGIGGVLSAIYFAGSIVTSGLLPQLLSLAALTHPLHTITMIWHIVVGAVLRTIFWFPDFAYSMIAKGMSFSNWLFGTAAIKG